MPLNRFRLHGRTRIQAQQIEELSNPLNTAEDLDPLLESIGGARCVLLGEALNPLYIPDLEELSPPDTYPWGF